jgi:hypothetical protein
MMPDASRLVSLDTDVRIIIKNDTNFCSGTMIDTTGTDPSNPLLLLIGKFGMISGAIFIVFLVREKTFLLREMQP